MSAPESSRGDAPGPAPSSGARRAALALAIAGLTFFAYHGVRDHAFVDFDDQEYVVANPQLDGRLAWADVVQAFRAPYNSNWAPLTSLSLAASDALHGPDPGLYATTNALLHALAALLLFQAFGTATGRWPASAFVAAVFAVHPLHVESVAWISERKDVLAGLFWMASLACHAASARSTRGGATAAPSASRSSRFAAAGVVVFGLLAMLAKATAVALPLTLLLFDLWPLGRLKSAVDLRRRIAEKSLLFAAAIAVAGITYAVQTDAGTNSTALTALPLRILNATRAYAIYVFQSLWPTRLAYYYPYPADAVLVAPASLAALVGVGGTTALALGRARRRPCFAMGWLWFVSTLVPMIGIVRVGGQAHADRYTYVAQTGLAVLLAFALPDALGERARSEPGRRGLRAGLAVAGTLVVLALAVQANRQVAVWQDSRTLFAHAVEVTRDNAHAHRFLGVALWSAGDQESGAHHLEEALRIAPAWGEARLVLATAHLQQGRLDDADRELERAARDGADAALVSAARGVLAGRRGDAASAARHYERALALAPDDWEVLNNLAWIRAADPDPALRDAARAVELAERAVRLKPDHAFVQGTLAASLASAGRVAEAVAAQTRAVALLDAAGDRANAAAFRARLAAYQAGRAPWQSDESAP